MKKAFMECYRAVLACEDETGRKRCELFREVPDRRVSPYIIPVSLSNHLFLLKKYTGLPRLLPTHHTTHCPLHPTQTCQLQLLQKRAHFPG